MLPSTALFLGRVTYIAQKRQIVAEFSNKSEKYTKRYAFFPKLYFPLRGISQQSFRQALAGHDLKRIKLDFEGETAVIYAATFSGLKKVSNLLGKFFSFHSNLIEPERQFLIEKGWGYFDPFYFESGEPIQTGSFDFPKIPLTFFSMPLDETITDLISQNRPLAEEIVSRVANSRLLKIPLLESEPHICAEEIFLENIFFASKMPLSFGPNARKQGSGFSQKGAELDFSRLVSIVAAQPFNNTGLESIGCKCCAPKTLSEKNVLPSSQVRVRFLKEGMYFNSASPIWAQDYHNTHPHKDARECRRADYFYSFYPVGPFARGEDAPIMLCDALSLQTAGEVEILQEFSPVWFCEKAESMLSMQINSLKVLLENLSARMDSEQVSHVAAKGLFFSQSMESDPSFFYAKALSETISSILSSLPTILTDQRGRFFEKRLAIAIETLRSGIMRELDMVVTSTGNEARAPPNSSRIVLEHSAALGISGRFSRLYRLGRPFISLKASF